MNLYCSWDITGYKRTSPLLYLLQNDFLSSPFFLCVLFLRIHRQILVQGRTMLVLEFVHFTQ